MVENIEKLLTPCECAVCKRIYGLYFKKKENRFWCVYCKSSGNIYKPIGSSLNAFQVGSDRFYPDWLHDAVTNDIIRTYPKDGSDGWKEAFDHAIIKSLDGSILFAYRGNWIIQISENVFYPCINDIIEGRDAHESVASV